MSKIEVHYSLKVAMKVVRELEKILPKEIAKECTIESWSNGREQGLCVEYSGAGSTDNWKSVVIAQQRCSDEILVVCGRYTDFDVQTNHPNDEIWKNKVHFNYKGEKSAAKYILDFFNK